MTKIFITGATGFIGTQVSKELLLHNYQLSALARSDASLQKLVNLGITPIKGNLEDLEVIKQAAIEADGVIHLAAFDALDIKKASDTERALIQAIAEIYENTGKFIINTSDILAGKTASEFKADLSKLEGTPLSDYISQRGAIGQFVASLASKGIRSVTIKLSPIVHDGETDTKGYIPSLFLLAKTNKVAGYIKDGSNRWAAIHVKDAAKLFRLAVEKGEPGSIYYGSEEDGVTTKEISKAVGDKIGVPSESTDLVPGSLIPSDPSVQYTKLCYILQLVFGLDIEADSSNTRDSLGWNPEAPGIVEDIKKFYN